MADNLDSEHQIGSNETYFEGLGLKFFKSFTKEEPVSNDYWNLNKDGSLDDKFLLNDYEEEDYCCHKGCSLLYNVQKKNLERDSFIMETLPPPIYLKLAPILGLDPDKKPMSEEIYRCQMKMKEDDEDVEDFIHLVATEIGYLSGASEDAQVNVGTLRNSIRDDEKLMGPMLENPYLNYLKRTKKTAEKAKAKYNLERRSNKITKTIISDFLMWFKSIGGEDETSIDESVLQDLFQIGFDSPIARAIAVSIKEMPTIPESLAEVTNEPEFAIGARLKKLLKSDIRLEERQPKLYAFGTMLPKEESFRFQPPKNAIKKTWTECQRVPPALESLKAVWEGIEHLRSTIAFSNWLKNHPEITPPKYLKEKGLLDINYNEWMEVFKGFEKDISSEGTDDDMKSKLDEDGEYGGTSMYDLTSTARERSMRAEDYESVTTLGLRSTSGLSWKM